MKQHEPFQGHPTTHSVSEILIKAQIPKEGKNVQNGVSVEKSKE